MEHIYDVVIIGGGPGGYSAALYSTRTGFDTLVIEKMLPGGQMNETTQIDNYPGFNEGIDGYSLGEKMKLGAEKFGVKTIFEEVKEVELTEKIKKIKTENGDYLGKTVVISTGANHRQLNIEKEYFYLGKGLAYCATCDGMFFKNKVVAVVGGGNSAAADALYLSKIAKKVYLIHRRDALRATKIYSDELMKTENIEFIWNCVVENLLGEQKLTGIEVKNLQNQQISTVELDGLFVSIGRNPATELVNGQVDLDANGYIIADESTRTNIPGVFAVGDVRTKALRQIVTAASDGAVASVYIEEYLLHNK